MSCIKETIAINPHKPLKIEDIPAGFFFEYNGEAYVKLGGCKVVNLEWEREMRLSPETEVRLL